MLGMEITCELNGCGANDDVVGDTGWGRKFCVVCGCCGFKNGCGELNGTCGCLLKGICGVDGCGTDGLLFDGIAFGLKGAFV